MEDKDTCTLETFSTPPPRQRRIPRELWGTKEARERKRELARERQRKRRERLKAERERLRREDASSSSEEEPEETNLLQVEPDPVGVQQEELPEDLDD